MGEKKSSGFNLQDDTVCLNIVVFLEYYMYTSQS